MTTRTAICPLDLEVGSTYEDSKATEESVFTVATIEVVGVAAKITDTEGNKFTYGGLYGHLFLVETPEVEEGPVEAPSIFDIARSQIGKSVGITISRDIPFAEVGYARSVLAAGSYSARILGIKFARGGYTVTIQVASDRERRPFRIPLGAISELSPFGAENFVAVSA